MRFATLALSLMLVPNAQVHGMDIVRRSSHLGNTMMSVSCVNEAMRLGNSPCVQAKETIENTPIGRRAEAWGDVGAPGYAQQRPDNTL